MKILFYSIIVLLLSSFLITDKHLEHKKIISQQDSITLYIYYKANKKKTFYIYKNDKIVFKAKTGVESYEYDSLRIALDSSNQKDAYLPVTAIDREGRNVTDIEFHIQNIPGYRYIFIDQNEFVKGQYIFKPYYFNYPIARPTRYD